MALDENNVPMSDIVSNYSNEWMPIFAYSTSTGNYVYNLPSYNCNSKFFIHGKLLVYIYYMYNKSLFNKEYFLFVIDALICVDKDVNYLESIIKTLYKNCGIRTIDFEEFKIMNIYV